MEARGVTPILNISVHRHCLAQGIENTQPPTDFPWIVAVVADGRLYAGAERLRLLASP